MASFERPGMYVPYPARCNPQVDSARANVKAWAVEVGILPSRETPDAADVWDERKFDDMDFALFGALQYPDAPGPELDLLAEWHTWIFYYDDRFLRAYQHTGDLAGAREHIDALLRYMPSTPGEAPPSPGNPVEAGLADLWPRTISTMSPEWSARFAGLTGDMLEEPLREVANARVDVVPDPISYVQLRRKTGGALWTAILAEHAVGVELPHAVESSRALRVLKDTFADGIHLRNDIFSYEKEKLAGEKNGVMVVEEFLGCTPQRAADLVNELATSRMQQFENAALVELPLLFADLALPPDVCLDVLAYLQGLAAGMAGDFEWAKTTGRYNENGAAGESEPSTGDPATLARLGIIRRVAAVAPPPGTVLPDPEAEQVDLPDFHMPYTGGRNPHLDTAYSRVRDWAAEMGMLGSGVPEWDEAGFESANPVRYAALMFPEAPEDRFELAAKWMTAVYFLGDLMDVFERRRDLAGAKAMSDRLAKFVPVGRPGDLPSPIGPLERGIADLWPRIAPSMTVDWRRWFSASVTRACEGSLWKILNVVQRRVPDPVDHTEMRRGCGLEIVMALLFYAQGLSLPAGKTARELIRTLVESILDWRVLFNDIVSFSREVETEDGGINNGVQIMRRFLGGDVAQAIELANSLATAQLGNFERAVAAGLPEDRHQVRGVVDAFRTVIAAELEAHLLVVPSRYATGGTKVEPETAPWRMVPWPTGLGTSAARIGALAGAGGERA
ncbi:terpene synthase family protein [Amycolatopsis azurea]|uniref:Terpene synthase n=1 Tax=Amycolatopsis azurea DSM 43854 TaxID=1238180 RepID=M2QII9_9PSEU|nr:hypothetical protein [Amycolatopsis azurea]EMD26501.1 Germacradienol synthase [Amycolatopsis azurea DSM 43854]OOC05951.1 hypothetical protein B0293_14825 [Amycolatopsis azurea DSM 43854]